MIPKKLIQTGKTRELSPKAKAAVSGLRLLHPEWEYIYFDDYDVERFVATEFPEYRIVFDSFSQNIQRIDFFRYLAVYRLGGFYFDLDVFFSRPLDPLLAYECIFPFEQITLNRFLRLHHGIDWEIGNYAFGAAPTHPFLGAIIENCIRSQTESAYVEPMVAGIPRPFRKDFRVLNTTGPGLVTRTFAEDATLNNLVHILFPADVRDSVGWHQFGQYGVHLMDGSWRSGGGFWRRRLACLWEVWEMKRQMADSNSKGPHRAMDVFSGSKDGGGSRDEHRFAF